jgi:branched-chain amino acid aminotransferase
MSKNADRLIWLGGKLVSLADAKVNVLAPTSQFGANVFEGIRCYWNDGRQQLYAFRLADHYARLKRSMRIFRMEDPYSVADLEGALVEVVRANAYREDLAVRQTIFIDGFGSWSALGPVNMFVAPIPQGRNPKEGFHCCIASWTRISERCMSPKVKVGANYINSRMAQLEATANGYDSAIFMNENGTVAEGPGSCLFIVRDGTLITPPLSASILESITRSTMLDLAARVMNLKVVERDVDRTELYICDEAFLCGSAVEIMPVLSVDRLQLNAGRLGPLTKKLRKLYLDVVCGEHEFEPRWLTPIY